MRSRPIVLLGEVHDNAGQHALRAQALRELLASGARPALLMEQFDRERQTDIDKVMAQPGATADDVIQAAGAQGTGWAWPVYRPFIALALEYRLPLVAANVSRADARRVSQEGLAATGFDAKVPDGITSFQTDTILASHCGLLNEAQARRMATAQVARDQFMARLLNEHAERGAVLLAGNGHVRNDVGVPAWLTPAVRQRSVGIGLLEDGEAGAEAYDRVITTTAPPARPDPCEGMKRPAS
ncbi:MAG: ChaN family lipoprotein [Burkholderiaceae bacterium]